MSTPKFQHQLQMIALRKGSTAGHQADAAYTLGHIGDEGAVEPLLRSLADPGDD